MPMSRTEKIVIGFILGLVLGTIVVNLWFLTHPQLVRRPELRQIAACCPTNCCIQRLT